MATLYTSNLETVKEATVNLDTWVKVKKKKQLKTYPINMIVNVLDLVMRLWDNLWERL